MDISLYTLNTKIIELNNLIKKLKLDNKDLKNNVNYLINDNKNLKFRILDLENINKLT